MMLFEQREGGGYVFTLRPNCSLGWRWMKAVFWGLAGCVALVSVYFVAHGAWLVLPFAGLELGVLGFAIYQNARWGAAREVVSLDGGDLRVYRGNRDLAEVAFLPRYWTRLSLAQDARGWYPSRVLLECHGRRIEVGSALVEAERLRLASDLREALGLKSALSQAPAEPLPAGLDTVVGQKI
jgi:uncharacterized membrane protein